MPGTRTDQEPDQRIGTPSWRSAQMRSLRAAVSGEISTPTGYVPLVKAPGLARTLVYLLDVGKADPEMAGELAAFVRELEASGWLDQDGGDEVRALFPDAV